jgi:hypothetical protein
VQATPAPQRHLASTRIEDANACTGNPHHCLSRVKETTAAQAFLESKIFPIELRTMLSGIRSNHSIA